MILTIILLSILVVTLGFTTYNLLKKNEKQEDILASYLTYLNKISDIIEASDKKIHEVDSKGSFESDDEVGFFFTNIKMIQDVLNQFKIKKLMSDLEVVKPKKKKEYNILLKQLRMLLMNIIKHLLLKKKINIP